jgi:hypothetical protein
MKSAEIFKVRGHGVFVVLSWRVCGSLWTVKSEGLPQLSPQAALCFDL